MGFKRFQGILSCSKRFKIYMDLEGFKGILKGFLEMLMDLKGFKGFVLDFEGF